MKIARWLIGLFLIFSFVAADLLILADPFYRWFYALLMVCFLVLIRLCYGPTPADRAAAIVRNGGGRVDARNETAPQGNDGGSADLYDPVV